MQTCQYRKHNILPIINAIFKQARYNSSNNSVATILYKTFERGSKKWRGGTETPQLGVTLFCNRLYPSPMEPKTFISQNLHFTHKFLGKHTSQYLPTCSVWFLDTTNQIANTETNKPILLIKFLIFNLHSNAVIVASGMTSLIATWEMLNHKNRY